MRHVLQVAELGRLVEHQLLVSSSALPQELLAAFLCAGAKGVVSLDDSSAAAASLDPAAAAAFFSAFYDALHRGSRVCQVCKQHLRYLGVAWYYEQTYGRGLHWFATHD